MKKELLNNLLNLSKIESDINEHLPLLSILSYLIKPKIIIELGVRAGLSTQAFLAYISENEGSKLYSYDIREVQLKSHYKECGILERLPNSINYDFWEFKIGDSLEVHNKWKQNSVDMLFIDTKHKTKQIIKELEAWHTKIKPTGLILMHDVTLKKAKLKEGIQTFQENHPLFKYIECSYNNGLGILFQPIKWIENMIENN